MWLACRDDILFYLNAFCWVFEPRDKQVYPFITWPFQDKIIRRMVKALGRHDILIEKSRDMGASWMCLAVFEHSWHFEENVSYLLVSRNESFVDDTGNPKALFWKIDFLHKFQPPWLLPKLTRSSMHLHNDDTGSTIDGESTNKDVARGDRRTAILLDEFAAVENGYSILNATADATDCRIFNSTPKGTGNAFYDTREKMMQAYPERVLRAHWSEHPHKAEGLYYDLDGRPRSPWYDAECQRRPHPQEIAQELDIDYLGSDFQFFDVPTVEKRIKEDCRPPVLRGEVEYGGAECSFVQFLPRNDGHLKLWQLLDVNDLPAQDRNYCVGVDVSTGSGASNSVIVVGDCKTAEIVAEYVNPGIRPEKLAELCFVIANWFGGIDRGAFVIWEANGPGKNFGDRLIELGYRNFFYRRNEESMSKKATDTPGWWATPKNKLAVMGEYRRALGESSIIVRSRESLRECLQYVFLKNQTVAHAAAQNTLDPSGARDNHGDRVVATALCYKIMCGRGNPELMALNELISPHSVYGRRQRFMRERRQSQYW